MYVQQRKIQEMQLMPHQSQNKPKQAHQKNATKPFA